MNIYSLYIQNKSCAGFWIQHRTWQNMCAQVLSVAEQPAATVAADAPVQHRALVSMKFFDVRSGRPVPQNGSIDSPEDRGYILIAEPPWSRRAVHRKTIAS